MSRIDMNQAPVVLRDVYIDELGKMMEADERVLHLDADMRMAIGSDKLVARFPERIIDTGVMEANMMGVACGLSVGGKIPFVHSFSVFATRRCADQIYMSGCYNGANVKIIGSDSGIYAEHNGGTHMSFDDVAIMRAFPQMQVFDVADANLLRKLLPLVKDQYGMCYIRFPRKAMQGYYVSGDLPAFTLGKGVVLREGGDVTIFAAGAEVLPALQAAQRLQSEGISAEVIDMFTIKPLDQALVVESLRKTGAAVTAENHTILGGLGSAVAEVMAEEGIGVLARIGTHDCFGEVGTAEYLAAQFGLRCEDIMAACKRTLLKKEAASKR